MTFLTVTYNDFDGPTTLALNLAHVTTAYLVRDPARVGLVVRLVDGQILRIYGPAGRAVWEAIAQAPETYACGDYTGVTQNVTPEKAGKGA